MRRPDERGTPNPLAGDVRYTFSFSISQPTRTLNDFVSFGFNQDERGTRVIDGMLKWVGAGNGVQINYRFAQPIAPSATGRIISIRKASSRLPIRRRRTI